MNYRVCTICAHVFVPSYLHYCSCVIVLCIIFIEDDLEMVGCVTVIFLCNISTEIYKCRLMHLLQSLLIYASAWTLISMSN